jgi:hypothetical protein
MGISFLNLGGLFFIFTLGVVGYCMTAVLPKHETIDGIPFNF